MSLPSDSDGETIYSDSDYSEDESIHESDIDFFDSETSDESSDEDFQDNKCTIFKSTVIIR